MLQEMAGWTLLLGTAVGVLGLLAHPTTRTYVLKYWWIAAIAALSALALILLRRKAKNAETLPKAEGDALVRDNAETLGKLVDYAIEAKTEADAQLARRHLASQQQIEEFDVALQAIRGVEDGLERRKALIKLVEGAKK